MYIYNKQESYLPILDPDYSYHSSYEKDMYDYFKHLHVIRDATSLAGLYIKFEINGLLFEESPHFYQKMTKHIQKKIMNYLDFGHANLFNDNSDFFFITMFNITEEEIQSAFLKLYEDISSKVLDYHHKKYTFHIHCGIYISHIYISPQDLLNLSKEQFNNTFLQPQRILSIKNSLKYAVHAIDKFDELKF